MAITIAKLMAVIGADTGEAEAKIKRFSGSLEGIKSTAVGMWLGQQMNMATQAMGAMASQAFTAYTEYERMSAALGTMVAKELRAKDATLDMASALKLAGPAAQELQKWVEKLAIKSPFDAAGVTTAMKQALAYGFVTSEAQRLTQAMIDFAAGTGGTTEQMNSIALALGQIKAKGKLAGQEVLQLVNAGMPVWEMLSEKLGKTTAEVQKLSEQGLIPAEDAIEAITGWMEGNFSGAAERATDTIGGLANSLSDLKEINLRRFFEGASEQVRGLMKRLADLGESADFQKKVFEMGQEAGKSLEKVLDGIYRFIELEPEVQKFWLTLAGGSVAVIALAGPMADVMKIGGELIGVLGQAPKLMKEIGAASDLLRQGESVFDVMSLGASGMMAALGPAVLVLGAVAAAAAFANAQAKKAREEIEKAAAVEFEGFISEERLRDLPTVSAVIADWQTRLAAVQAQADETSKTFAGWFVNEDVEVAKATLPQLSAGLALASKSYEEYQQKLIEVSGAQSDAGKWLKEYNKLLIDAQGNIYENFANGRSEIVLAGLSEESFATIQKLAGLGETVRGQAQDWQAFWEAQSGASAGDVSAAYTERVKALEEFKSALNMEGLPDELKDLGNALMEAFQTEDVQALNQSLWDAATSYEDYAKAAMDAGIITGQFTKAQWEAKLASDGVGKAALGTKDAMKILSGSLSDANWGSIEMNEILDDLNVKFGMVDEGAMQVEKDMGLMTDAFAVGVISYDALKVAIEAANNGTLALTESERASYTALINQQAANEAAAEAAREHTVAMMGLTEAFYGASQAELARQAMADLKAEIEAHGDPTGTLTAQYYALGDAFYITDEKSRALAEGWQVFLGALQTQPDLNAVAFLSALNQEATDGLINWAALETQFGLAAGTLSGLATDAATAATLLSGTGEDVTSVTGQAVTDTTDLLTGATGTLSTAATEMSTQVTTMMQTMVDDVELIWLETDWEGIGGAVVDGLEAGLTAQQPYLIATVTAMAQAVEDAFKAELDINSPSGVFEEFGRYISQGLAKGMGGDGNEARTPAQIMLGGQPSARTAAEAILPMGGGGQVVQVIVQGTSMFSLADEQEAQARLEPIIKRIMRK